jgi:hypothetical protein
MNLRMTSLTDKSGLLVSTLEMTHGRSDVNSGIIANCMRQIISQWPSVRLIE